MHIAWANKCKLLALILGKTNPEHIKPLGRDSKYLLGKRNKIKVIDVKREIGKVLKKEDRNN
jgi:hypothetical protein